MVIMNKVFCQKTSVELLKLCNDLLLGIGVIHLIFVILLFFFEFVDLKAVCANYDVPTIG